MKKQKKKYSCFRMTLTFGGQKIKRECNLEDAVLLLKSDIPFHLRAFTGTAEVLLEEKEETTGEYVYYDSDTLNWQDGTVFY